MFRSCLVVQRTAARVMSEVTRVQIIVEDGMKSVPWLALVVLLLASPLQVDAQQITGTVLSLIHI